MASQQGESVVTGRYVSLVVLSRYAAVAESFMTKVKNIRLRLRFWQLLIQVC
jgi:hypothetical protein